MNDFKVQLRKGLMEYVVLGIISKGKIYGRDILTKLNKGGIVTGEGTLYPLLAKLKSRDLLVSELEESSSGAARKYYTITRKGEKYLKEMNSEFYSFIGNITKLLK